MRYTLLILLCVLLPTHPRAQEMPTLGVLAEQSLALPLAEIARVYARERRIAVSTAFAGDASQGERIAEESPLDLLITADGAWIESLRQRGLMDVSSEMPMARNRLALIGPKGSGLEVNLALGFPVAGLINAMGSEPLFVLGNPENLPVGSLSREALRNMEANADMEPYTLYLRELSQIIRMVAEQQAYAMVFASDATSGRDIRLIGLFPEKTHSPVVYRSVVLAGSNMAAARAFALYLQSKAAQAIFEKYGFSGIDEETVLP